MPLKKKPEAILQLEKWIGQTIPQVNESDNLWEKICFCMTLDNTITGLNLKRSGISDLSPITQLTELRELYISYNQITDISPIAQLVGLRELHLFNNQITNLSSIAQLTRLERLLLEENQITDLSPISQLSGLHTLYLNHNQITDISPIAQLTSLKILDLRNNQITDLSPIAQLTSLEMLDLRNNQITDLSPIAQLTRLGMLYLSDNQITDLSPIFQLASLRRLTLSYNKITYIPPEILRSPISEIWKSGRILLDGNPLESPPIEIVRKGYDAIVSYFKQMQGTKVPLLQCKLLIVGAGEVGKTTLMKKLKNPSLKVKPGKEATTHGINILPWELPCCFENNQKEKITISLWDFGGQDIYHATHQFFLTKRSVYILVWEARKEEESRTFDYWLNVIKLLGSGSPIIVVMNKSDVRIKSIDEATLTKKFPDIKGFFKVSCVDDTGLSELTQLIQKSLAKMPHLRDLLPSSWIHIRDELKALDKNYIPSSHFFELCEKHKINHDDAITIADYLHDLGVILYFRNDPLLADTVILKPEWATTALYTLCDTKDIILNKGSFKFEDLKRYWNLRSYPVDKHLHIIRLMEKFELCFNFLDTPQYFVPELLPGDPAEFDRSNYQAIDVIHFQYQYKFMPEGILSRFISRLYYIIHLDRFWKYGVELTFDNSTAIVLSEPINSRIQIHVIGSNKKELLSIIRSHFNHIHQTLNMISGNHYNEMIPCNCNTCTDSTQTEEPNYYSYTDLIKYNQNGIRTNPCKNSFKQIDIDSLLNGFQPSIPDQDILKTILEASKHVMGLSKSMKPDEDSRTGLLCLLMNEKGFIVKDQTRWGQAESGKSPGRLDAMIKSPDGEEAVLEAFKLTHLDSKVINDHCLKLFNYDPVGLKNNFIVVYCDCDEKTFSTLWNKYKNFVSNIEFPYKLKTLNVDKTSSPYAGIKIAHAIHNRHNTDVGVYHLFLHMVSK